MLCVFGSHRFQFYGRARNNSQFLTAVLSVKSYRLMQVYECTSGQPRETWSINANESCFFIRILIWLFLSQFDHVPVNIPKFLIQLNSTS